MHEKAPRDLREINHIKMRKRKDKKKSKLVSNAENCIKSYVVYLDFILSLFPGKMKFEIQNQYYIAID